MKKVDIPDVNVWIALSIPSHAHHARAKRYWSEEAYEQLAFCSVTMVGLVRICSNAPIIDGAPISPERAWSIYEHWFHQSEVVHLLETDATHRAYIQIVSDGEATRHNWTDCYLAALAKSTGSRLVSFDSDFKKFEGLNLLHLQD